MCKQSLIALVLCFYTSVGCESKEVSVVEKGDNEAAQYGRSALLQAVVEFSENRSSAQSYAKFSSQVTALSPILNRELKQEAELRLCVLAIGPLKAHFEKDHQEQMHALATTVWPSVLQVPVLKNEDVDSYVRRLCKTKFSRACHDVVPQYWPIILNELVWRSVKDRIEVAFERCRWCEEDPKFGEVIEASKEFHAKLNLASLDAQKKGKPSAWPVSGIYAQPLATAVVVAFAPDGTVTMDEQAVEGGDWRKAIQKKYDKNQKEKLALWLRPQRMVGDLLLVLKTVNEAGYSKVALVARERDFPYQPMQYSVESNTKNFKRLGVQSSDTIQVLVQALDFSLAQKAGKSDGTADGTADGAVN